MTDGSTFKTRSTWGKNSDTLKLEIIFLYSSGTSEKTESGIKHIIKILMKYISMLPA